MKSRILLLTLSILAFAPSLRADEDSPLEGQMKILARGTRQLGQQISNPAMQQSSISLLETLKKAAVDSKTLAPSKSREIPEDKRVAFLADYRTDLDELRDAFDQVEQAVKAGDYAKAQSLLTRVNAIKKEGHAKFQRD